VAPLFPLGQVDVPPTPARLGCGVRLSRAPRRFLAREFQNGVHENLGTRWLFGPSQPCLVTSYRAASYGDPSGAPEGGPRTKQDAARQRLQLATLALWLARPTAVYFRFVAQVQGSYLGGVRLGPVFAMFEERPSLPRYASTRLTAQAFREARKLNEALNALGLSSPGFIAARYLWVALNQEHADVRIGILWMAVEALFGPADQQSIGESIRRRVGAFFGGSRSMQVENFVHAAAGWKARCEVMHGATLGGRSKNAKECLLLESESIVRAALRSILLNWRRRRVFETDANRDRYLTRLSCAFERPNDTERKAAESAREKEIRSMRFER
jgi:hypothetical protein